MIIDNGLVSTKKVQNDAFSEMLKETNDLFKSHGINMFTKFSDIITENTLYQSYTDKLQEGLSEDDASQMQALFDNQRLAFINESTLGDIAPIAGLSMPMLRKTWVKCSLKNAIETETATKPAFAVTYMKPVVVTATGEEFDPTKELRWADQAGFGNLPAVIADYLAPSVAHNLITSTLVNGVAASKVNGDALNTALWIQKVKITVPNDTATEEKEVVVKIKAGLQGEIYGKITTTSAHALPANQVTVTDTLFGKVDFTTGDVTVASALGLIKGVSFLGTLTQEANTRTDRVEFRISKQEINIPAASHMEASLPMEFIQDTMALYNIDAAAEATNLLSELVSQKLDQEIYRFFESCDIDAGTPYQASFDCRPAPGFNGKPTEWRSELKTLINYWCVKIREDLQIETGYFVLMGNPLDMMLLDEHVSWTTRANTDSIGGVMTTFDMGVLTGANTIKVVSSSRVPAGKLRIVFYPTTQQQKSYVYYPYSYILSSNLRSGAAGTQNLPTIVVSKRHIMHKYSDMQFTVNILNNKGIMPTQYIS